MFGYQIVFEWVVLDNASSNFKYTCIDIMCKNVSLWVNNYVYMWTWMKFSKKI